MQTDARASESWQAVALDLLRRRADAEPHVPTERLRDLGGPHESKLSEKRIDSLYYSVCNPDHPRQRMYQLACDQRIQETLDILHELESLDVEPLVLDDNEASIRYDHGLATGETATITLLVPQDALWKAEKVLYGRGYVQGDYNRNTHEWVCVEHARQLRHELQSCKLWPFRRAVPATDLDDAALREAQRNPSFLVRDDGARLFLTVEVRHALAPNLDTNAVLQRSIAGASGARALSRADQLWSSMSRCYDEAAAGADRTLRGLVWIAPLIADPNVDWNLLVRTAVEQKATSAHLYWLTFFCTLGAKAVPADALQELRSHHHRSERNWGWQLEHLFDVEPTFPQRLLDEGR